MANLLNVRLIQHDKTFVDLDRVLLLKSSIQLIRFQHFNKKVNLIKQSNQESDIKHDRSNYNYFFNFTHERFIVNVT